MKLFRWNLWKWLGIGVFTIGGLPSRGEGEVFRIHSPPRVITGTTYLKGTLSLAQVIQWSVVRHDTVVASGRFPEVYVSFSPPLKAGERITVIVLYRDTSGKERTEMVAVDVLNAPPEFKGADVEASPQEVRIHPHFDDPEGDSLTVEVLEPEGFVYDAQEGVVRGPLPEAFPLIVKLRVSDGENTLEVTIPVEERSASP